MGVRPLLTKPLYDYINLSLAHMLELYEYLSLMTDCFIK
jgi:hypothetical protein